jgi:5-methylcytosine-specific restriction endonuclease McrA
MSGSYDSPGWRLLSALVTLDARCTWCGTRDDLVAHHRTPRAYGGSDTLDNLEPVCRRCHTWAEAMARARVMVRARREIKAAAPLRRPRRPRRAGRITPTSR